MRTDRETSDYVLNDDEQRWLELPARLPISDGDELTASCSKLSAQLQFRAATVDRFKGRARHAEYKAIEQGFSIIEGVMNEIERESLETLANDPIAATDQCIDEIEIYLRNQDN